MDATVLQLLYPQKAATPQQRVLIIVSQEQGKVGRIYVSIHPQSTATAPCCKRSE